MMMTNLLTDDLGASRDMFVDLLKFRVDFEADWFVSLADGEGNRVGVMSRTSEFVPDAFRLSPQGVIVTFVVDDVDAVFERAKELKATIVEAPTDLPYGQRRLLLEDPSGALVDISSPTAPLDPSYR